jgi:uncharacterized DUF497 family protein
VLDFDFIEWDDEQDPRGNAQHIAAAGLTVKEIEEILYSPYNESDASTSSGRPAVFGTTGMGKYIIVVYTRSEQNGVAVIRPATAYEVDPPY